MTAWLERSIPKRWLACLRERTAGRLELLRSTRRLAPWMIVAGVLGATGCLTLKIADIPAQRPDAYRHRAEQGAVRVALQAFTDSTESDRYFGTVLLDHNVLAVLVVAENRGTSSSYVLAKEQCRLGARTATDRTEAPVAPGVGTGLFLAGAVLLSPPLLVAGIKLGSDAEMIRHNFYRVELKRQTISPGQTARGVVYFGVTDEQIKNPSTALVLHVSLPSLDSDAVETVAIPFGLRDR
jgi:hypothetical protein